MAKFEKTLVEYQGRNHLGVIHPRGKIVYLVCNPGKAIQVADVSVIRNPAFSCNCKECKKTLPQPEKTQAVKVKTGKRGRGVSDNSQYLQIAADYLSGMTVNALVDKYQANAKYGMAFVTKITHVIDYCRRHKDKL